MVHDFVHPQYLCFASWSRIIVATGGKREREREIEREGESERGREREICS